MKTQQCLKRMMLYKVIVKNHCNISNSKEYCFCCSFNTVLITEPLKCHYSNVLMSSFVFNQHLIWEFDLFDIFFVALVISFTLQTCVSLMYCSLFFVYSFFFIWPNILLYNLKFLLGRNCSFPISLLWSYKLCWLWGNSWQFVVSLLYIFPIWVSWRQYKRSEEWI